jgi:ADP-ribose pyrophosphatase YjhB (NUDIX family)
MATRRSLRTRLWHVWFRLSRPATLGVRALVSDGQGRVLLLRHTYTPGWHMPGGGVERGESAQGALAKELREEVALTLTGPVRCLGLFANHANFPGDHVSVWHVAHWQGDAHAASPTEIAEVGWFSPDALPEGTTPGTRARIAEWAGGAPVSEHWAPEV